MGEPLDSLHAGAAVADITPTTPQFLYGYPFVPRISTGVHDPLLASALYLAHPKARVLFVAADVIFVSKQITRRVRQRIEATTGIPAGHIMVTATHTHSGPVTVRCLSNEDDPVVPPPDENYLKHLEDGIVEAAVAAVANARPAELGLAIADGSAVGTNRHDPAGPRDPEVPVLIARDRAGSCIGLMLVCSMHPTVLHEDSTLVSGDFPAMARQYLQRHVVGADCPVVYHTGAAGNQSPRHVIAANTFAEAERLGTALGRAVEEAIAQARACADPVIAAARTEVDLPLRSFPRVPEAMAKAKAARERLDQLRLESAPRATFRTAECDWFGATELLTLARAAAAGRLPEVLATCLPAEIQVIWIGPWRLVAWPGEAFVEFALEVKSRSPGAFVITLANGELQSYLVTQAAVAEGRYEASNALFASPESGQRLVRATLDLIERAGPSSNVPT